MGADGYLLIIEFSKVKTALAGRDPERLGWSRRILLGREVLLRYWDADGKGGDLYHDPRGLVGHHRQLFHDLAWLNKEGKDVINVQGWRVVKRADVLSGLAAINADDLAESERWVTLGNVLDAAEDWQMWT